MRTYKIRLYKSDKLNRLECKLDVACEIFNHCIALHRRYYRLFGKHLSKYKLQKHITKLKKSKPHWKTLDSQAIQDITDRIDRSYNAFFLHIKQKRSGKKRPPHFRKRKDYRSFTLKQSGYKFGDNYIVIQGIKIKFFKSQEIEGAVKTVTVKRMPTGKWFVFVVTDAELPEFYSRTGKSVGMDFGLKDFLVLDDGTKIKSSEHLKTALAELKKASHAYSLKQDGSNNQTRAYLKLMRIYEKVQNCRRDDFFKLAHYLCKKYDHIAIEDLNLDGMKRLWGRKVSDLAYGEFVLILEHVASKYGVEVKKIDRYAPSSKACHVCGTLTNLSLKDRTWTCPDCGTSHDRDINAAINIKRIAFS